MIIFLFYEVNNNRVPTGINERLSRHHMMDGLSSSRLASQQIENSGFESLPLFLYSFFWRRDFFPVTHTHERTNEKKIVDDKAIQI